MTFYIIYQIVGTWTVQASILAVSHLSAVYLWPQGRFLESGDCAMLSGFRGAPQPLFGVTPCVSTLSSTPTLPPYLLSYPCTHRQLMANLSNNQGVSLLHTGVHCAQRDSVNDLVSILGLKTKLIFLIVTPEKAVLFCVQPTLLVHLPAVFISSGAVKPFRRDKCRTQHHA